MTDAPRARIIEIPNTDELPKLGENAQLVLDDPDAVAVIRAIGKVNCAGTLEMNAQRVAYFRKRIRDLERTSKDVVIVIIMVDDPHGGPLAEVLMPGHDWQAIRDGGEQPVARGLAGREGVQEALKFIDADAGKKLKEWDSDEAAVVVVDHGVAEIF